MKGALDLQQSGASASDILWALGFSSINVGGGLSLFKLYKWLKGQPIKDRKTLANGNTEVRVKGNNNAIEVYNHAIILYDSPNIRRDLAGILEPLENPGIDKFIVRENGKDVEVISKEERPYFSLPATVDAEEGVLTTEFTAYCPIIAPHFTGGKWRLSLSENSI